jgi:hypothetical protein
LPGRAAVRLLPAIASGAPEIVAWKPAVRIITWRCRRVS